LLLPIKPNQVRHGITEQNEVAQQLLNEDNRYTRGGRGLETLEGLQAHDSTEVYEKAAAIVTAHFDEDDPGEALPIELLPPHLRDAFYSTDPSETPAVVPAAEQPEGSRGGSGGGGGGAPVAVAAAAAASAVAAAPPAALASSLQRLSDDQDGKGDGGNSSSSSSSSSGSDDDGE
jgi:hypothetical protein